MIKAKLLVVAIVMMIMVISVHPGLFVKGFVNKTSSFSNTNVALIHKCMTFMVQQLFKKH